MSINKYVDIYMIPEPRDEILDGGIDFMKPWETWIAPESRDLSSSKIDIEIESARAAVNRRGELSRTRAESTRCVTSPPDSSRSKITSAQMTDTSKECNFKNCERRIDIGKLLGLRNELDLDPYNTV